jgi:hypothetical protein
MEGATKPFFTITSAVSLAFVASIGLVGYAAANAFLPKNARKVDRWTFIWLVSTIAYVATHADEVQGVRRIDSLFVRGGVPLVFPLWADCQYELRLSR